MISSKKITLISIILTAVVFVGAVYVVLLPDETVTGNIVGTEEYSDIHSVTFSSDDYYTDYSTGSIAKINLNGDYASSESRNVEIDGAMVTILGGGTYVISGELDDGTITVDAQDSAQVRLVLNGVSVTSSDFAALYVKQAEKTIISLVKGTDNYLTDGAAYDEQKLGSAGSAAALLCKDDLTVNGEGTLTVNGNCNDAVKVNDGLKVTGGTLKLTAVDDGINVNDYISVVGASFEVSCGGDAVKCENEEEDKGFVALSDAVLILQAGDDGITASSAVYADGGSFDMSVGGDALHAGTDAVICPETMNIAQCREGIEGAYVTINGGDIRIVSSDDGINAVGTGSAGGFGAPMGMRKDTIDEDDIYLTVNGGNIYVETSGDGLDSNGAAVLNGGCVEVYGPENSGNSSLDFEYGFIINGGTLIAAGSSGMAEPPADSSAQSSLVFCLDESCEDGSKLSLTDADGNALVSGTTAKKYNWVCISSADIEAGKQYTLIADGKDLASVEASGTVTSWGNQGRGQMKW